MMNRNAAIYLRVSSEQQAAADMVSIEQQEEVCRRLCEAQGFKLIGVYMDKEKYMATQAPKKGKKVEPSGTRVDRPGFQQLLTQVESGDIDAVVAFDSSRIGRHLRVLGAIANSLDLANEKRNGRGEVAIWEADKNNSLNRLMLSIMITIAQEENETRVRRTRMGRIGTLERGLWPSHYFIFGYKLIKAERGYRIEVDEKEAEIVRFIYTEALNNSVIQVRLALIARGYLQPDNKLDWHLSSLQRILTDRTYTGKATWEFGNGEAYEIEVPQIIEPELFEAVQKALESRKAKSQGSLKVPALLHHIGYCAECGRKLSVNTTGKYSYKLANGTRVYKEVQGLPVYYYTCHSRKYAEMNQAHTQIGWYAPKVDETLWRLIVDNVIRNPDEVKRQITLRQQDLQQDHEGTEGSIERCDREIKAIQDGRQRLIIQLDKGIIEQDEFEAVMVQRKKELKYWQEERGRLSTLLYEQKAVEEGLSVMVEFLKHLEAKLADLDRPLKGLPQEEQFRIMAERQGIVQTICKRVNVYPGGILKIEGLIDTPQTDNQKAALLSFGFLAFILSSEPVETFDNFSMQEYTLI